MKTKLLVCSAVAGLFMLASCSKKASEETMKSITDFETARISVGDQAAKWSGDVKACTDKAMECNKNMEEKMGACSTDMKAHCDSMMTSCKKDGETCGNMLKDYETFKTTWDVDTKAFTDWKEKVTKGEVDDGSAKKALADYQSKLDANKIKVDDWSKAFETAKAECDKNMSACENHCKMGASDGKKDACCAKKK